MERRLESAIARLIMIGIIIIIYIIVHICDAKIYNNGICKECQIGHYIYKDASGDVGERSYRYECDNCHDIIEVFEFID